MNLSMIIPYFKPEVTAIVHLMEDLAQDLGKYGAKVTIITGYPLRGTNDAIRKEYFQKSEELLTDNIKVLRVGSKRDGGNSFFIRALRYMLQSYRLYKKAKIVPADVYYIYSTPPTMGIVGAFLSNKAPTLYCLQDIFPDNLQAQQKIKDNTMIFKVLKGMESFIYRKNNHIVTISRDMKDNLRGKGVRENKISVIGNWIDTEEIQYISREDNPLFEQFNLDRNGFYVSYSGNIGYAQDMDIIMDCAKIVLQSLPEIQFIIIGNGVCKDLIKKKIEEEGINNIHLLPMQPEEHTGMVYSLGDIGLVTLKRNMHAYAMPSKTWAMMSASQPIICTAVEKTQLYEIIYETKAGIIVNPGDYKMLAEHIINLYYNKQSLKDYGLNGRTYAEKNLSRETATAKYFRLLTEIAGERS